MGEPGVPCTPQILAEQLTLSQPEGADYAHQIILAPQDSDLNMALDHEYDLSRGISILGEVRNAEISRVTQQLLCSKF